MLRILRVQLQELEQSPDPVRDRVAVQTQFRGCPLWRMGVIEECFERPDRLAALLWPEKF
jgi:hypothetical protein